MHAHAQSRRQQNRYSDDSHTSPLTGYDLSAVDSAQRLHELAMLVPLPCAVSKFARKSFDERGLEEGKAQGVHPIRCTSSSRRAECFVSAPTDFVAPGSVAAGVVIPGWTLRWCDNFGAQGGGGPPERPGLGWLS